jgi:hypothetical protein
MDPPRLDYAPPHPRNLRRHVLAFLVGYLVATIVCWVLTLAVVADRSSLPLVILIAPVYLLMAIVDPASEKVALFLILVVGPALYGLYATLITAPPRLRIRLIVLAMAFHAACFALLAVV